MKNITLSTIFIIFSTSNAYCSNTEPSPISLEQALNPTTMRELFARGNDRVSVIHENKKIKSVRISLEALGIKSSLGWANLLLCYSNNPSAQNRLEILGKNAQFDPLYEDPLRSIKDYNEAADAEFKKQMENTPEHNIAILRQQYMQKISALTSDAKKALDEDDYVKYLHLFNKITCYTQATINAHTFFSSRQLEQQKKELMQESESAIQEAELAIKE